MKAIVVRQPWATLIALGVKSIETRPGPPNGPMRPEGVRGLPGCSLERGERIAIVAGAQKDDVGKTGWAPWAPLMDIANHGMIRPDLRPLAFGAVVCTVTVEDAVPVYETPTGFREAAMTWVWRASSDRAYLRTRAYSAGGITERPISGELPLGDFTPGRWGWLLGGVQQTDPIPCKGRQGVFTLPDDIAERLS